MWTRWCFESIVVETRNKSKSCVIPNEYDTFLMQLIQAINTLPYQQKRSWDVTSFLLQRLPQLPNRPTRLNIPIIRTALAVAITVTVTLTLILRLAIRRRIKHILLPGSGARLSRLLHHRIVFLFLAGEHVLEFLERGAGACAAVDGLEGLDVWLRLWRGLRGAPG